MNASREGADLTCVGKLFHASGAAAEKPRSPNFSRVLGRVTFKLSAERRRIVDVGLLFVTGTTSLAK